jgi:hypothetical protein
MAHHEAVLDGRALHPLDEAADEPTVRLRCEGSGRDRLSGCGRQHAIDSEQLRIQAAIGIEQRERALRLPASAKAVRRGGAALLWQVRIRSFCRSLKSLSTPFQVPRIAPSLFRSAATER